MSKWSPVAVAGAGLISSIGNDINACLSALANGQAGMDEITWLDTAHRHRIPVAEVKCSNARLAELAGVAPGSSPGALSISRTAMLGLIAAREALEKAAIPNFTALRTGIVSANTVGGMDRTENFFIHPRRGKLRDVVRQV